LIKVGYENPKKIGEWFFVKSENHTNSEKKTSDPMENPTRLKLWRAQVEIYGSLTANGGPN
jgi:hypothetical protein